MAYIYVAGPYSLPDPEVNTQLAIVAADLLWQYGHTPYIPHLSHHWHKVIPHDYEDWMKLDFAWLDRCDAILRLPGVSPGADREIERATRLGKPVYMSFGEVPGIQTWFGKSRIVVIGGPSGAGKSSAVSLLETRGWKRMVTVTTRATRAGELQGRDYYFLSPAQFNQANAGGMIGETTEYIGNGRRYGIFTVEMEVAKHRGVPTIAITDAAGLEQLRHYYGREHVSSVYLLADRDELARRMQRRGDTDDSIAQRLARYDEEVASATAFDHTLSTASLSVEEVAEAVAALTMEH